MLDNIIIFCLLNASDPHVTLYDIKTDRIINTITLNDDQTYEVVKNTTNNFYMLEYTENTEYGNLICINKIGKIHLHELAVLKCNDVYINDKIEPIQCTYKGNKNIYRLWANKIFDVNGNLVYDLTKVLTNFENITNILRLDDNILYTYSIKDDDYHVIKCYLLNDYSNEYYNHIPLKMREYIKTILCIRDKVYPFNWIPNELLDIIFRYYCFI